ncbi:MAG: DNA polymerase Y family protein, partial [Alphaproteobacteria bacterium]|nr:DNA polymerase Y family protein [Alphaproteobacteria bacterium]
MMRRVLSVWLPRLPTDRLCRAQPAWRAEPLATVSAQRGGLRIIAVTPAAAVLGIVPGLTLADARALFPGLKVAAAAPAEEAKLVAALADWCGRYSPWTAADGDEGIWIEITGAAHLHGGEAALLADLRRRLGKLGFASRAAIADTPGAAWAAARFHPDAAVIAPPGGTIAALSALPVQALRLAPLLPEALARVGLDTIGALLAVPRAPLAARFGAGVVARIEQFLGTLGESISPRPPAPDWRARLAFAEPLGRSDDILAACARLIKRLCTRLARDQRGARRLELVLYLVDGQTRRAAIGTSRPVREPRHLHQLFREPLLALELGFGVEVMVLAARETEPLAAEPLALPGVRAEGAELAATLGLLLDRLANRLGEANVRRFAAR